MRLMAGWWRTTGASRSLRSAGRPCRPAGRNRPRRGLFRRPPRLLVEPLIRIGGGDAETGTQDHDVHRRQVGKRINIVAAPEAECGAADKKVRHVGAKPRADTRERGEVEIQFPQRVQREQRHRGVGAAATEPGFRRHALAQIDRDIARRRGPAGDRAMQQRRGLPRQIAPIGRDLRLVAGDGKRSAPRGHRHVVEQRERLKDGLEIVKPIWTRSENTEVQIDLCERGQTDRSHRTENTGITCVPLTGRSIVIHPTSLDQRRMVHQRPTPVG